MRRHLYIVLTILSISIIVPTIVFAQFGGSASPFGGRIVADRSVLSAAMTCDVQDGPFIISPVNGAPSGPYFLSSTEYSSVASKEGSILTQLQAIRSSSTYTSGHPTAQELSTEQDLVDQLKATRDSKYTIQSQHTFRNIPIGGWALGLYNPVPDLSVCKNTETGAPIPAYRVSILGTS